MLREMLKRIEKKRMGDAPEAGVEALDIPPSASVKALPSTSLHPALPPASSHSAAALQLQGSSHSTSQLDWAPQASRCA